MTFQEKPSEMEPNEPLSPWKGVSNESWSDWRWHQKNRIRDEAGLEAVVALSDGERRGIDECADAFRMAITPYYASLMDPLDPECPIRRQAIPHVDELKSYPGMRVDPLAEEEHSPVPGLVHRYPDRVLLYLSHNCPVYCRHCTRKRKVGDPASTPSGFEISKAVEYVQAHSEIRDVLLSGGDPLTLSDETLDRVISSFLGIRHVDLVRLGTRNPVTLPQRVTPALCEMLARHRPVYLHTHFNHPRECTPDAARALEMLSDAGCVLGNQMVLMKGINDDARIVEELNRWLLRHRCKPYYILQCDLAPGVAHFRTHTSVGRQIISELRGHITGLGIPHYVVDLPGGGGKVPLVPNYMIVEGPSTTVFRNFKGAVYPFHEVENGKKTSARSAPEDFNALGIK